MCIRIALLTGILKIFCVHNYLDIIFLSFGVRLTVERRGDKCSAQVLHYPVRKCLSRSEPIFEALKGHPIKEPFVSYILMVDI